MQKVYVCPYCHSNIKQGTDLKVCPACETPHHIECWLENNGCTSFGCSENPETKKQNQPVVIPIIPGPEEVISLFPCPNCSKEIEEGSSYCKYCGYKLINVSENPIAGNNEVFNEEFKKRYEEKVRFHRNRLILLYSGIFLFIGIFIFGIYKISDYYQTNVDSEHIVIDRSLNEWRRNWENKNVELYGNFLSDSYKYTGADGKTINKETKLKRIETTFSRYKFINIRFSNVNIKTIKKNPPEYLVTYNEDYKSDKFESEGKTELTIIKENGEYKIIREVFK